MSHLARGLLWRRLWCFARSMLEHSTSVIIVLGTDSLAVLVVLPALLLEQERVEHVRTVLQGLHLTTPVSFVQAAW